MLSRISLVLSLYLLVLLTSAPALGQVSTPVAVTIPCTTAQITCTNLQILNDPYSTTGQFAGYADPSPRRDPLTGLYWMAYSWPHTIKTASTNGACPTGSTQSVDIHLASSATGTSPWTFQSIIYASVCVVVAGVPTWTADEVMNIFPQPVQDSTGHSITCWYGANTEYNVLIGGAGTGSIPQSHRTRVAQYCDPDGTHGPGGLSGAPASYYGGSQTDAVNYPITQNLTSLSPDLAPCVAFDEPTWASQGSLLYLFLDCGTIQFYAGFTAPNLQSQLQSTPLTFSYVPGSKSFATAQQGAQICPLIASASLCSTHSIGLTQMDRVDCPLGITGNCASISAVYFSPSKVSVGAVLAGLASLSPPAFALTPTGQIKVYAQTTSPDSQSFGPGSSTYTPAAGMLIAHKNTSCTPGSPGCSTQGGFFTYLMQTGAQTAVQAPVNGFLYVTANTTTTAIGHL